MISLPALYLIQIVSYIRPNIDDDDDAACSKYAYMQLATPTNIIPNPQITIANRSLQADLNVGITQSSWRMNIALTTSK